jgi:2-hydroxy-3-keto-5-methylthiopentenyl-1-phosphate phosphatase
MTSSSDNHDLKRLYFTHFTIDPFKILYHSNLNTMNLKMGSRTIPRIVFCDFDGTITTQETFEAVLKRFAPELSAELMPQMYALQLTLREGVRRILESVPSAAYPEIVQWVATQPQRPGLSDFLAFLQHQNIPFVVITGGLQAIVESALKPFAAQIHAIYGLQVDTQSSHFQISSPAEGETELVSKVDIMGRYSARETIVIGDSVTDLSMALAGDIVFARDRLAQYLDERGVAYVGWADFHDIRQALAQRWSLET